VDLLPVACRDVRTGCTDRGGGGLDGSAPVGPQACEATVSSERRQWPWQPISADDAAAAYPGAPMPSGVICPTMISGKASTWKRDSVCFVR
jgi:hypothetical protein